MASSRRGRLPADAREARQDAILDAAIAELVEHGADGMSMLGIARRAGASKGTLSSWFGGRDGLLTALIQRNADGAAAGVEAALAGDADPHDTLIGFATGLLRLLTSPSSVALNRAAMTSPDLASLLLQSGRHRVGPIVERYLAALHDSGELHAPDAGAAFELLYGLVMQDVQIRVLLGEEPPIDLERRASDAIDRFLRLCAPA